MSVQGTTEFADSADGTSIGFLQIGSGPALVFVHGSLSTGDDWLQVATAMSGRFTCYLMDRRGRGRSGDARSYDLAREYEDISAVLNVAGPGTHLLGHSYGAICALGVALSAPVGRLVLYEPPLPVAGSVVGSLLEPYRIAVAAGQLDDALTTGLRDIVRRSADEIAAIRATPLWSKMAALTPTWTRELEAIDRLPPSLARYAQLSAPTLLLLGTATAAHHQGASAALSRILPNVRTVHIKGEGHAAHLTAPDIVATEVTQFLLADH